MTPDEMLKQAEKYLRFARDALVDPDEMDYKVRNNAVQTFTALAEAHTNLAFTIRQRHRDTPDNKTWTTSL